MADKKISELPLLNSVSGSSIIVPLVHDGTTNKLNLSQIAHYASQWSAKTGSANTFTGNQSVIGNVNISGKLTVNSIEAVYETSSILYTSGSTQIGDQITDVHTIVGTINLNGLALGTNELMAQTASQAAVNFRISSTTGSINTTTSSFDSVFLRISSVTGSINAQSSSQDLVNRGISSITGAINTTTSSFDLVFQRISSTTGSINTTTSSFDAVFLGISSVTGSINSFTASVSGQVVNIATFSGSVNFATQSLNTQTGSQDLVNRGISSVTGSINTTTSSFDSVFLRISSTTGSINTTTSSFNSVFSAIGQQTASQDLVNRGISSVTGSINTTTSSFNSVFSQIGSTTSSLIGITNGLMAFTAALDNTYATDAQLYQLYQATASIHSTTSSLNSFSGSVRSEINLLEAYTASLKAAAIVSSSTQITNYYKFAETASSNTFYGNQTIQGNLQLSATSPLVYNAGNTNAMLFGFFDGGTIYGPYYQIFGNNYSNPYQRGGAEFIYDTRNGGDGNFHVSSYNGSTWTQKFRVDDDGIEVTGSALVTGDVRANKFVFTDGVVSQNVGGQNIIGTSGNILYLYTGTSGLYINNQANNAQNVTISDAGVVQTRGKLTVGSPGNDQDIAFGGSNSKLDWAGTGAQIQYSVGALQFSSVGTTNNMILQQQAGALFNAGITGSLMATNNVVSSSTQIVNYNIFARTGSANTFWGTQTFSGSVNLSGSMQQTGLSTLIGNTVLSGSIAMSGSTAQVGNNTLTGNTVLSGSINVSGSSNFNNSEFRVSGSSFFTGSHTITGNSIFSGSINIASGSSYYRAGNKLFNYGQWGSVQTQSGSINTASPIKLETKFDGSEGISVANNGSGFPTRITIENTGLYNIQFSLQLNTTATETCDFSVWFAITGSNIANSNTDFSIDKTAGGGNGVAALNLLTPITAGDYVELYWSNNTGNGQLLYKAPQSTPTRPATPSAIVTITQVA